MIMSNRRTGSRLLVAAVAATFFTSAPIVLGTLAPAQAQESISVEFRTALEPYGHWQQHSRWGEVWVPADRPRDWRPYTVGHWVHTDDWGWYWIEDQAEAAWGLITFHYGRWVMDGDVWVWVPGTEWGPGWVNWRHSRTMAFASGNRRQSRGSVRGAIYVGWAPLPPEEIVTEIWEEPSVWIFVRARDFTAPVVARVLLPRPEREIAIRETIVVNRTVVVRDQRFAVNPGIPATVIAADIGRPLRSFQVRPVVLAGTVALPGALQVRAEELRSAQSDRTRVTVRETRTEIRPAARAPELQPLRPGEQGRFFDNPPRAANGRLQPQPGTPPSTGQQQPGSQQPGVRPRPPETQGQGAAPQRQQPQGQPPAVQRRQPEGTQGQGAAPQRQQPQGQPPAVQRRQPEGTQGQGAAPQRREPPAAQRRQPEGTQGQGNERPQPRREAPAAQPRQPEGTQGQRVEPPRAAPVQ